MKTKNKNLNFSLFLNKNLTLRKLKMSGTKIGILIYCTVVAILIIICFIYLYKKLKELLKKSKNKKLIKLHRKHLLFQQIITPQIYESDEEEVCPICLQNIKKNKSKVCITKCKHVFHFYCLKKYVLNSDKNICPLCKEDLFKDTKFDIELIAILNAPIIPLDEKDNPINELNQEEIKAEIIIVQNHNKNIENERNAYQNSDNYL